MAVKMRGILASGALVALLLAAAWADHHHHHHGSDHSHELSSPNSDFAFALYKSLNAKTAAGKNIFYSPLGISTALSVLATGARGETHRQLFSSLGYSNLNQTQVNEEYQHLFDMHGHSHESQQLDVGNAVALRSGCIPLEKFLKDVRHHYAGEVFNINFTNPAEAAAELNRFIANKTHDKIKDMVKDLDPDMAMMLINYVYFKGEWKEPFNWGFTSKMDFHVDETTKVQADMMLRTAYYDTYWDVDNHTVTVVLPFKGNTSMMVILPDEGKMAALEGIIDKDHIKHLRHSASKEYSIDLFLPKFSISADVSLENTLKEMGIINAFEDKADFSGISDEVKLKVSKVSHKAVLSVTETGTEAEVIANTDIAYVVFPLTVRFNRPFLVFILDNLTETILYMGKISNPTAM